MLFAGLGADMGSFTCKCNRLQLQLLWNFMITDYDYNYFFSKCNRLQLLITLQSNHDYFMITFKFEDLLLECYPEERKT